MEALINMVCELKITSGSKKLCKIYMVIRQSVNELLVKNSVTRPMKYIVGPLKLITGLYQIKTSSLYLKHEKTTA